jgi:hypothetical protein
MSDAKNGIHTVYKTATSNGSSYYPSYHDAVILGVLEYGDGAEWMSITREVVRFEPKVGQSTGKVVHLLNNGIEWVQMNQLVWDCDNEESIKALVRIANTYEQGYLLPDGYENAEWYLSLESSAIIAPWGLDLHVWKTANDTPGKQQYILAYAERGGHLLHGRFSVDTMMGRMKVYANPWKAIVSWLDYHNEMEE